ncbi:hypothetical protein V1477_000223 [Vespula maculifrons]|uniref:Uncharacterized protein n=1 Tax=Vespula maculifrons TaxID=7453 RepID=A0ABD2D0Z5_VESMC
MGELVCELLNHFDIEIKSIVNYSIQCWRNSTLLNVLGYDKKITFYWTIETKGLIFQFPCSPAYVLSLSRKHICSIGTIRLYYIYSDSNP